jgi:hypothetical protein
MLAMPLGDLTAGSYSVTLNVTGQINNVTLIDSTGGDYPMTISSDGKTVTFKLAQDTDAVGLNAVTTDDTLQVTYKAKKSPGVKLDIHMTFIILPALVLAMV